MTDKIINGDYARDNNDGLQTIDYIDEVLQNVKILLTAGRGKFYPNKNFGSMLDRELRKPINETALAYSRLAVEDMDGVFISSAQVASDSVIIDLTINGEEKQVKYKIGNYI